MARTCCNYHDSGGDKDERCGERRADKTYLGDGAYAERKPNGDILLSTENGYCATNRIVLEPDVAAALLGFFGRR